MSSWRRRGLLMLGGSLIARNPMGWHSDAQLGATNQHESCAVPPDFVGTHFGTEKQAKLTKFHNDLLRLIVAAAYAWYKPLDAAERR
jgi:hypothetical protein